MATLNNTWGLLLSTPVAYVLRVAGRASGEGTAESGQGYKQKMLRLHMCKVAGHVDKGRDSCVDTYGIWKGCWPGWMALQAGYLRTFGGVRGYRMRWHARLCHGGLCKPEEVLVKTEAKLGRGRTGLGC